MNFQSVSFQGQKWGLCFCAFLFAFVGIAQDEEAPRVKILQADVILRDQNQPDVQRLIGGVILGYDGAKLFCDSALRYQDGRFQTMGHVDLQDEDRSILAESMLLNPTTQMAFAESAEKGVVTLRSPMATLQADRIAYDLDAKWIYFPLGGHLIEEGRTAFFDHGIFKVNESLFQLGGDVIINDGDWSVASDSLHWDEKNAKLFFFGKSHFSQKDGALELHCSRGEFDQNTESGWFASDPDTLGLIARIRQDDIWIEADRLVVPQDSIEPLSAVGRVEIQDTARVWKVWGTQATRHEIDGGEFIVSVSGDEATDARYMDASSADTLWLVSDSMEIRSDWARFWPGVHLIQGSAAAACETLFWEDSSGHIELIGSPFTWLEDWLLKADSMTWKLKENQPEKLSARGHSGLVFDLDTACMQQISGRNLDAFFTEGTLHHVEVNGNAESIYFDSQNSDPCEAFNRSVSSSMRIDFEAGEIQDIVLLQNPEGVWSSSVGEAPQLPGMVWMALPDSVRKAFEMDCDDFLQ